MSAPLPRQLYRPGRAVRVASAGSTPTSAAARPWLRQLLLGKELLIDVELRRRRQDDEVLSEYLLDVATRIRGAGFAARSASLHGYSRRIGNLMLRSPFGCEVAAAARDNDVRRPRLNLHFARPRPRAIGRRVAHP